MTNGSKFEPREQMNRALKPGVLEYWVWSTLLRCC